MTGTGRLALLIDAENVAATHFPAIAAASGSLGTMTVARLYGDFADGRLKAWLDVARRSALEVRFQISGGAAKNSTDIAMAIDAMDILHGGSVDTICIASSDRDFAPLAVRLRAGGCRVIGFGRKTSCDALRMAFSEFRELDGPVLQAAKMVNSARPVSKAVSQRAELTDAQVKRLRAILQRLKTQSPGLARIDGSVVGKALLGDDELAGALGGSGLVKRLVRYRLCEADTADGTIRLIA